MAIKTVEMDFTPMSYIVGPPQQATQMYAQACSSDGITIETWRKIWVDNAKANKDHFGNFRDHAVGRIFGTNEQKPCIVVGSGPSLANNIGDLKENKKITVVSCLHNFHYLEDNGVRVDYYVSLDAGEITIEEISEGGSKTHEEYLDITKDRTLIAFIGSPPKLLKQWRGDILFFNCPIPNSEVMSAMLDVEQFHNYVSTGGNVLGACTYVAKAILGSNPIVFTGADFCFGYTNKFHPWDSKYDRNLGHALRAVDIYGNAVRTWQSYYNFKTWFDWLAVNVPGLYINASEGGTMGAYPEGNIQQIIQMELKKVLRMYNMHYDLESQFKNPELLDNKIMF